MATTKEKATGKIKIGHDWSTPDRMKISNRDPNYHYRWVRNEDKEFAIDQGREIVDPEEFKRIGAKRNNDMVLTKMPIEMKDDRDRHFEEKNKAIERSVKAEHKTIGKQVAIDSSGNVLPLSDNGEMVDEFESKRIDKQEV